MNIEPIKPINEAERVRIAEACARAEIKRRSAKPVQNPPGTEGYKCDLSGMWILECEDGRRLGMNYKSAEEAINGLTKDYLRCNDFGNSLQAMHEAEKVLTDEQADAYFELLDHTCAVTQLGDEPQCASDAYTYHASALQRARAFLRVIDQEK